MKTRPLLLSLPARRLAPSALLLLAALSPGVQAADAPPAANPQAAKQAIEQRRALYTLIGASFRPLGEILQGKADYDAASVKKRVARLAFYVPQLAEHWPEGSATGETKAKPEIWSNRADFDQRLKDFDSHVVALAQTVEKSPDDVAAFKSAAGAIGKDCKGCHDEYKSK